MWMSQTLDGQCFQTEGTPLQGGEEVIVALRMVVQCDGLESLEGDGSCEECAWNGERVEAREGGGIQENSVVRE